MEEKVHGYWNVKTTYVTQSRCLYDQRTPAVGRNEIKQ